MPRSRRIAIHCGPTSRVTHCGGFPSTRKTGSRPSPTMSCVRSSAALSQPVVRMSRWRMCRSTRGATSHGGTTGSRNGGSTGSTRPTGWGRKVGMRDCQRVLRQPRRRGRRPRWLRTETGISSPRGRISTPARKFLRARRSAWEGIVSIRTGTGTGRRETMSGQQTMA